MVAAPLAGRQVARKPLPGELAFRHAEHHDLRGDFGLKPAVIVRRQRALQTELVVCLLVVIVVG